MHEALEQLARLAALRGLRALPLHARSDQERDPDAVRDRLPARLRGAQPDAPSTTCGSSACSRPAPDAELDGRRCASCRPRASAKGASSAGSSSPPTPLAELADGGGRAEFEFERRAALARPGALRAERSTAGRWRGCELCVHNTTDRPRPARSSAPRRCCASLLSTHVVLEAEAGASSRRWSATAPPAPRSRLRERQHLAGARLARRRRGPRRGDRAARPPADRAREPRQPVRQHRDRGGAAAARAGALATRSASEIAAQDPAVREMIERAARRDARGRCIAACTAAWS